MNWAYRKVLARFQRITLYVGMFPITKTQQSAKKEGGNGLQE